MNELKATRANILDTAKSCVCGDREQDYGTPEQNFSVIAKLWTAYKGVELTAIDVAVFLSLVKIGRISSGHGKADNWIDLAGYAACGGEIEAVIVAELERLRIDNTPITEPFDMGEEDTTEPFDTDVFGKTMLCNTDVEPVKGKYEGLSDMDLKQLICFTVPACGKKCPLFVPSGGFSTMSCTCFPEFRAIAIPYLNKQDALEGKE